MSKQPEALRLADELQVIFQADFHVVCEQAAAELRRQHALIAELIGALRGMADEFVKVYPVYYYAEPWAHDRNEALKFSLAVLAKAEGKQ